MSALYEITAQHRELAKLAEESEEMALSVADTMESIEGDFEDKAISLIHVVSNIGADIPAIDEAIARLSARKKSIQDNQKRMKDYLRINMEALGIKKITSPLFTINITKGRDIVSVDNESDIPADFMNVKVSMSPMKKEILAALKNGDVIKGVSMVKSDNSLKVK